MFLLNTITINSAEIIRRQCGRNLSTDQISLGVQEIDKSKLSSQRQELIRIFEQHGICCKTLYVGKAGEMRGIEVELKARAQKYSQALIEISGILRRIGFRSSTVYFRGNTAIINFNNQIVIVPDTAEPALDANRN